ncbi:MAG: sulfite exporter TauE/SafE family protein, partial [Planctomycetota bacterium]|nr:sulfite exporter TauE/SafE family protein [Planctomycetota bacterium]
MEPFWMIVLGLAVGAISGLLGLGGALLLIPGLVYISGFSQHKAQGTTLAAMVPPIGLFAALQYYRQGFVDPWAALWIAIGFALGAFVSASFISRIDSAILSQLFGMFLLFTGVRMILSSQPVVRVFAGAVFAWLVAWALYIACRHWGGEFA